MKRTYIKNGTVVEKKIKKGFVESFKCNEENFSYNNYPDKIEIVPCIEDDFYLEFVSQLGRKILVSHSEAETDAYIFYFGNNCTKDWDNLSLYSYYEKVNKIINSKNGGIRYIINILHNSERGDIDLNEMTKYCVQGLSKGISKKYARIGMTSNVIEITDNTKVEDILNFIELFFNNHYISGEQIKL